jgi:hypothetical protein
LLDADSLASIGTGTILSLYQAQAQPEQSSWRWRKNRAALKIYTGCG